MKTIKETYKEKQQKTESGVTETRHIKLLNKCNVAEEDDDNCQLEVEK